MVKETENTDIRVLNLIAKVLNRSDLNPFHIALYTALLKEFLLQNVSDKFRITRRKIMALSQIRSITTYHRCIKGLVRADLIKHHPSYHPKLGTEVEFVVDHIIFTYSAFFSFADEGLM